MFEVPEERHSHIAYDSDRNNVRHGHYKPIAGTQDDTGLPVPDWQVRDEYPPQPHHTQVLAQSMGSDAALKLKCGFTHESLDDMKYEH